MRDLLIEYVRAVLSEKRRGKKPGGPRTDMGAIRQLDPGEFSVRVKGAVDSAGGDVDKAAGNLEVAPRTLYHYLDTEPGLANVKTTEDKADDEDTEKYGRQRKGRADEE